jgi:hypothetical protein
MVVVATCGPDVLLTVPALTAVSLIALLSNQLSDRHPPPATDSVTGPI